MAVPINKEGRGCPVKCEFPADNEELLSTGVPQLLLRDYHVYLKFRLDRHPCLSGNPNLAVRPGPPTFSGPLVWNHAHLARAPCCFPLLPFPRSQAQCRQQPSPNLCVGGERHRPRQLFSAFSTLALCVCACTHVCVCLCLCRGACACTCAHGCS